MSTCGLGCSQGAVGAGMQILLECSYRCLVVFLQRGDALLRALQCFGEPSWTGGLNDPNLPPGAVTGSPRWME